MAKISFELRKRICYLKDNKINNLIFPGGECPSLAWCETKHYCEIFDEVWLKVDGKNSIRCPACIKRFEK